MQQALLLEIDELLTPNDAGLSGRRASLTSAIQDTIKPPVLLGNDSQPERIRKSYVSNKIALQLEGLPVDDQTPALNFWQYVSALEEKYRRTKPTPANEPVESIFAPGV